MLNGEGNQYWMRKKFNRKRTQRLTDRSRYSDSDLLLYECETIDLGGGRTDSDTYEYKQFPYPQEKSRKQLDIRDKPEVGG